MRLIIYVGACDNAAERAFTDLDQMIHGTGQICERPSANIDPRITSDA